MQPAIIRLSKGEPKSLLHKGNTYRSGICKEETEYLDISRNGIAGDDVENHKNHGGPERVVCSYPYEHYSYWEKQFHTEMPYSAFGENLTVSGMKESEVFIGDVFQIGEAVLQVSQGRFPCATINKYTGIPSLLNQIIKKGYTGYFFRVKQEGIITARSEIKLIDRIPKQISIAAIHHTYFFSKNINEIETILSLTELSAEWRTRLKKLYNQLI